MIVNQNDNQNDDYFILLESIKDYVLAVQRVKFMVLVRTSNYAGSIVAAHIDELNIPEIVSTLAGINNIMIICQSDNDADIVLQAFKAISE